MAYSATYTTLPTLDSTIIGYNTSTINNYTSVVVTSGVTKNISSVSLPTAGVYIVIGDISGQFASTAGGQTLMVSLSTANNTMNFSAQNGISLNGIVSPAVVQTVGVFSVSSGTSTIYLNFLYNGSSGTVSVMNTSITYIRVA